MLLSLRIERYVTSRQLILALTFAHDYILIYNALQGNTWNTSVATVYVSRSGSAPDLQAKGLRFDSRRTTYMGPKLNILRSLMTWGNL